MYEIVPYRTELRPEIAHLQRHLWRGDEVRNTAYMEWKYERNPYLPALIYLALHGSEVVGMRGMFGSCWEIGPDAEGFVVPCGDDLVIAPAHRHRGLLGRIMDATVADLAAHGHPVTFSLSAGAVALAGSLARGWRSVGSVREVSRAAGPPSLPWRLAMRVRSWPGARRLASAVSEVWRQPFRHLDTAACRTPAGAAVWCTREPRPEEMADLVGRLGYDGRVRHVRDARYLAWRFANPLHEYRFLMAGNDRLEGYLVLQASRLVGRGRVNVVDWEAASPGVRRALLRAAIDWGRFAELSTWTMSLSEEARALLVQSASPSPGGLGPVLAGRRLLDAANWDMRMLYSMAG